MISTFSFSFFFPVSLQVDIVPSQGEISVGESKFFLCQGKCPGSHRIPKLASKTYYSRAEARSAQPRILTTALLLVSSVTTADHSQRLSPHSDMLSIFLLDIGAISKGFVGKPVYTLEAESSRVLCLVYRHSSGMQRELRKNVSIVI